MKRHQTTYGFSKRGLPMLAATLFILSAGCASTKTGTLSTKADYNEVFNAARQAAIETGFGITSADKGSGFISGQMAVGFGEGTVVVMSVQLTRTLDGTEVEVSIVPPSGTVGNIEGLIDKFSKALKKRVPDVEVSA